MRIDEFWWDKGNNPVGGATYRHKKPLMPGEVIEVQLTTQKNPRMFRNNYQFSHANGTVKTEDPQEGGLSTERSGDPSGRKSRYCYIYTPGRPSTIRSAMSPAIGSFHISPEYALKRQMSQTIKPASHVNCASHIIM